MEILDYTLVTTHKRDGRWEEVGNGWLRGESGESARRRRAHVDHQVGDGVVGVTDVVHCFADQIEVALFASRALVLK